MAIEFGKDGKFRDVALSCRYDAAGRVVVCLFGDKDVHVVRLDTDAAVRLGMELIKCASTQVRQVA